MITFIIPTLCKSIYTKESINEFMKCKNSNLELIIINNSRFELFFPDKRIKVLDQKENLYVNKSWNLGVSKASNEYVCLLNDDIVLNLNLFINSVKTYIINNKDINFGMLALENFEISNDINDDNDVLELNKLTKRGLGFGQLMLLKKSTYEIIPEEFKIFFGDDIQWLVNNNYTHRDNFYFTNLKIKGEISASSKEVEDCIQSELVNWDKIVNKLYTKYHK